LSYKLQLFKLDLILKKRSYIASLQYNNAKDKLQQMNHTVGDIA